MGLALAVSKQSRPLLRTQAVCVRICLALTHSKATLLACCTVS